MGGGAGPFNHVLRSYKKHVQSPQTDKLNNIFEKKNPKLIKIAFEGWTAAQWESTVWALGSNPRY